MTMKRLILLVLIFFSLICSAQNKKDIKNISSLKEQGSISYEKQNYKEAFYYFEKALNISNKYYIDSALIYYTALTAHLASMYKEANYYYKMGLKYNFEQEKIYCNLSDTEKELNNIENSIKILQEGFLKYPQNSEILFRLIGLSIETNDFNEPIYFIDKAIEKEPNNHNLYFAKGIFYDKTNDFSNAVYYYELAIAKNPKYYEAYYNLGALYYNKGIALLNESKNFTGPIHMDSYNEAKYNEVVKKSNLEFEQSIQYFEKAYLLNKNEKTILTALKELYLKFNKENYIYQKCYNEIVKKINGQPNQYVPYISISSISQNKENYTIKESNNSFSLQTNQIKLNKSNSQLSNLIDTEIPTSSIKNLNTFALVIGNETYLNEIPVEYAINDALTFAKYLNKTMGIPESNIKLLTNATLGQIYSQIKWLSDVQKAYKGKSSIIIYYAGHGMPDETTKDAYIIPVDGISEMPLTAIKLDWIYNEITLYSSQIVTVFLDACFSGGARSGMLAKGRGVKIRPKSNILKNNLVVFSATSENQTAYPYEEMEHGLFTYYLLEKMNKSKGSFTLGELYEYVSSNVEQKAIVVKKRPQTPTLSTSNDFINLWKEKTLIE